MWTITPCVLGKPERRSRDACFIIHVFRVSSWITARVLSKTIPLIGPLRSHLRERQRKIFTPGDNDTNTRTAAFSYFTCNIDTWLIRLMSPIARSAFRQIRRDPIVPLIARLLFDLVILERSFGGARASALVSKRNKKVNRDCRRWKARRKFKFYDSADNDNQNGAPGILRCAVILSRRFELKGHTPVTLITWIFPRDHKSTSIDVFPVKTRTVCRVMCVLQHACAQSIINRSNERWTPDRRPRLASLGWCRRKARTPANTSWIRAESLRGTSPPDDESRRARSRENSTSRESSSRTFKEYTDVHLRYELR